MTTTRDRIDTDVLVVGAGAAGFAAALAAGRNGARTLLIDRHGFVGGIASTIPWLGFHDRDYRQVVKGIAHECVGRLQAEGSAGRYELDIKCGSFVSLDGHRWKCLALDLLREAGVRVLLEELVIGTLRERDRIVGVVVADKSGVREIRARVTIDCSGDGDVAARGGVACERGRRADGLVQAPSLVVRIGGIDRDAFVAACRDPARNYREWLAPHPELYARTRSRLDRVGGFICGGFQQVFEDARAAGEHDLPQSRLIAVKTHRADEMTVVSTRVLGLDPTDADRMSDAYARLYGQVDPLLRLLRARMPGFARCELREIAPMMGVRESRRVVGDYQMTAEDLVDGRVFADRIGMGAYHIDIHRPDATWVSSRNVRAYTMPLRSLIAAGVDGLLMAGKCVSATHEAIGSTRVIPICMAQGQAAGTAAAMAMARDGDPRAVPIAPLQERLRAQGAELGETLGGPDRRAIEEVGQLPFDEDEAPLGEVDRALRAGVGAGWVR